MFRAVISGEGLDCGLAKSESSVCDERVSSLTNPCFWLVFVEWVKTHELRAVIQPPFSVG